MISVILQDGTTADGSAGGAEQRGFDVMKFHVAWAPDWHPALIDMAATSRLWGGGK